MFATLEEKIVVAAISAFALLVGILGWNHHERSQGAVVCVQQDQSAELAQSKKETADALATVTTLDAQLAALGNNAGPIAPLRMCNVAPRSMSPRVATASVEPATISDGRHDPGVQAGNQSGADIGPAVQDITLGCVLGITDANDLWQLAMKESAP